MLGTYSYHQIIRKTVVAFGTMFNNIELRRTNEVMKVPLAYGPKQKFLARLNENPDPTNKRIQITLPRISFEMGGMVYDPSRKTAPTQSIVMPTDDGTKQIFMPVPYNIDFEVAIIARTQDDSLQIVEQILPYFQPHYNLSIKYLPEIGETRDVPIILNSIDYEDDYEGEFAERRAIIYTLKFTAKAYLYGPVREAQQIRKAIVDAYGDTNVVSTPRILRYQVQPEATQDMNNDGSINGADDALLMGDDDFGFNELVSEFVDNKKRNPSTGVDVSL